MTGNPRTLATATVESLRESAKKHYKQAEYAETRLKIYGPNNPDLHAFFLSEYACRIEAAELCEAVAAIQERAEKVLSGLDASDQRERWCVTKGGELWHQSVYLERTAPRSLPALLSEIAANKEGKVDA